MNTYIKDPKEQPLYPIQHILDKLSYEDQTVLIDFFLDEFEDKVKHANMAHYIKMFDNYIKEIE